jgi:hypothetical protein
MPTRMPTRTNRTRTLNPPTSSLKLSQQVAKRLKERNRHQVPWMWTKQSFFVPKLKKKKQKLKTSLLVFIC